MIHSQVSRKEINLKFELIPNPYGRQLKIFWSYCFGLLLPLFLLHCLLISFLSLSLTDHLMALGIFTVTMVYLIHTYLKKMLPEVKRYLVIREKLLEIWDQEQLLYEIGKPNLRIEEIGWGACIEKLLPAIRMTGQGNRSITIGASRTENHNPPLRNSVQASDFILAPEIHWEHFVRALK